MYIYMTLDAIIRHEVNKLNENNDRNEQKKLKGYIG